MSVMGVQGSLEEQSILSSTETSLRPLNISLLTYSDSSVFYHMMIIVKITLMYSRPLNSVYTALSSCDSNLNPVLPCCMCPCQSHGVDVSVMASRLVVLGQISVIWHWRQFLQIWFLLKSEKERISLSRDDLPNCYLMSCGQPWNHTHTSKTK